MLPLLPTKLWYIVKPLLVRVSEAFKKGSENQKESKRCYLKAISFSLSITNFLQSVPETRSYGGPSYPSLIVNSFKSMKPDQSCYEEVR